MSKRFVYIYLRNQLSHQQIEDIDQWLHNYCKDVKGSPGHWRFKLNGVSENVQPTEQLEDDFELDLNGPPSTHLHNDDCCRLNDCLGYEPQQEMGISGMNCTQQERQLLTMLAQMLAQKCEGVVHYNQF